MGGGPVNWSPTHSTGPQPIQLVPKNCFLQKSQYWLLKSKNSKNLVHLFSNFDSGRTSQPVPNPFNWSPTHSTGPQKLFFTEISVSVAQIKKFKKLSPFIFEFCSWEDQSTGPQPIQLVPKNFFLKKSQ